MEKRWGQGGAVKGKKEGRVFFWGGRAGWWCVGWELFSSPEIDWVIWFTNLTTGSGASTSDQRLFDSNGRIKSDWWSTNDQTVRFNPIFKTMVGNECMWLIFDGLYWESGVNPRFWIFKVPKFWSCLLTWSLSFGPLWHPCGLQRIAIRSQK